MSDLSEWQIVNCRSEKGNILRNKHSKTILHEFVNHGLKVLLSVPLKQAIRNTVGGSEAKQKGNNV